MIKINKKLEDSWIRICNIHLLTKHYLLIAEEMNADGDMFLQPLKEHRDAYDHIIRVYAVLIGKNKQDNPEEYIKKNMSKAEGHEYRAFFDTADWISIICREKIYNILDKYGMDVVKDKYQNYDELKGFLAELPQKIAEQREKKDIGRSSFDVADSYMEILDKLIEYWKELSLVFG